MGITFFHIDAGSVGITRLESSGHISNLRFNARVGTFIFQGIATVKRGSICHLIFGTEPYRFTDVTSGQFTIQFESIANSVVTSNTNTAIIIAVTGYIRGILNITIG